MKSGATVVSLTCFSDFLTQFNEGGSPPGDVSRRGFGFCMIKGVFFSESLDLGGEKFGVIGGVCGMRRAEGVEVRVR